VKKKMICCLTSTTTHAAPASKSISSLSKIITSKDFIPRCCPYKETCPTRGFGAPNALPREGYWVGIP
jgi:hypothetical protein